MEYLLLEVDLADEAELDGNKLYYRYIWLRNSIVLLKYRIRWNDELIYNYFYSYELKINSGQFRQIFFYKCRNKKINR